MCYLVMLCTRKEVIYDGTPDVWTVLFLYEPGFAILLLCTSAPARGAGVSFCCNRVAACDWCVVARISRLEECSYVSHAGGDCARHGVRYLSELAGRL